MTTVSRKDFVQLGRNGGKLDLGALPEQLEKTLEQAGISHQDLEQIAGSDHVIRGDRELGALYKRVDQIESPADRAQVRESLREQIDHTRAIAAERGGKRFESSPTLKKVAAGKDQLEKGEGGKAVRLVQEALIDIGALREDHKATGYFDGQTEKAVRRYQRDAGVRITGTINAETLSALTSSAPAPGRKIERKVEHDRLFADGRLDVTMAVGYDEGDSKLNLPPAHPGAEAKLINGLKQRGFERIHPESMKKNERAKYGLDGDRYDPNAAYYARSFRDEASGKDVTAVVRLITPGADGAKARASFERALEKDEVVVYTGHARYGTGPDFDDKKSGDGNFVIDPHGNRFNERPPAELKKSIEGRKSDLAELDQHPDYQLLIFNACNSEEYFRNLRDPKLLGTNLHDTDVIGTQASPRYEWTGQPALRFLDGLMKRESNNEVFESIAVSEQAWLEQVASAHSKLADTIRKKEIPAAGHTHVESGFLGNSTNQIK